MNKKIEELAIQAGLKLEDLPDDVFVPLEKFVELILTECKSVLLDMIDDPNRDFDTLDIALTEINDKFGIEE